MAKNEGKVTCECGAKERGMGEASSHWPHSLSSDAHGKLLEGKGMAQGKKQKTRREGWKEAHIELQMFGQG